LIPAVKGVPTTWQEFDDFLEAICDNALQAYTLALLNPHNGNEFLRIKNELFRDHISWKRGQAKDVNMSLEKQEKAARMLEIMKKISIRESDPRSFGVTQRVSLISKTVGWVRKIAAM
jgi:hypothetical protein